MINSETETGSTKIVTYADAISKDKAQHLTYNNPMFQCMSEERLYSSDILYAIPEHWHEDLEYLIVLDGELHYNVEGEKFVLHKGEGVLINSKRIHSNRSPKGESCLFCYAIIHPSYLTASPYVEQKYIAPLLQKETFSYLLLKEGTWTEPILDEVIRMFRKPYDEALELEIIEVSYRLARFLFLHFQPEMKEIPLNTMYDTAFKSMLSYLQGHYMDKVSLEELAEVGNIGKTLCTKLFKKYTSKTPGDYLINYRITKSIDLLKSTEMEITEIAFAVGFSSNSHFTKTFREVTGTTPLKYRREIRRGF